MSTCTLNPNVKEVFDKFRKNSSAANAAITLKVVRKDLEIVVDEELEDVSVEDLQYELPDLSPRYIIYSYKWERDDGRVQYPIVFIFYAPREGEPYLSMMYASSKDVVTGALDIGRCYEVHEAEEFTEEWLQENLKRFN